MALRWLLGRTLRTAATSRAQSAARRMAAEAARGGDRDDTRARRDVSPQSSPNETDAKKDERCYAAIVFDRPMELEAFLERLSGVTTTRAAGLEIHVGGLGGRQIAAVVGGAPPEAPARIIETLIAGHQPKVIFTAGAASGLSDTLRVGDIVIASQVVNENGAMFETGADSPSGSRTHGGRLLTALEAPRTVAEKQEVAENSGACAIDASAYAICDACRGASVPCMAIRVIREARDEETPPDVAYLLAQDSFLAKSGAFTGALWRRPGSMKDLWRLKERAFEMSDRLAAVLAERIR